MEVLSKEDQRIKSLKTLFDSSGWKYYKEDRANDLAEYEHILGSLIKVDAAITQKDLANINYYRAKIQELNRSLITAEALEDEANSPDQA